MHFCHLNISQLQVISSVVHHHIRMRRKKPHHDKNELPPDAIVPGMDLNLVNNDQLHQDVWDRLSQRLRVTSNGDPHL
jgi:hypothetical protein